MDITPIADIDRSTQPHFIDKAEELHEVVKKMSPKKLMSLMHISQKLADENWERNQEWKPEPDTNEGSQAAMIFRGEVYRGFDFANIPSESYDYLASNMKILSGLYGLLNAFDRIMPYRLEMGTALKYKRKKNLYAFWGDDITEYLNSQLQENEPVIDIASNEYTKAINQKILKGKWIEVDFKDEREGKLKSIMTYFKHARGAMLRECAINKVETMEELKSLIVDNYSYKEELSTESKLVFVR